MSSRHYTSETIASNEPMHRRKDVLKIGTATFTIGKYILYEKKHDEVCKDQHIILVNFQEQPILLVY
jgi:hypothetical protein